MKNTFKNPVPSLAKIFNSSLIVALALVAAGCPKKAAVKAVDIPPVIQKLETKCVQVYYDKTTASSYTIGKTYALMLLNLLGHFPDYQQTLSPIESYKNGDLEKCDANFYIGSSFDNPLPQAFLVDYKSTTKLVTWMGYNFWQLGPEFERTFGYRDHVFTALDEVNRTPAPESKPTFFRDILYKGETFTKFNAWKPTDSTVLQGAFEMCKLSTKTSDVSQVLATARHSFNNEEIPWALQNHNKFYVTEIPFSYAHEGDRYLVFSDLLFDMIGAKPMSGGLKRAVIRLADINPLSQLNWLDEAAGILKSNGVLPHLSV